ncbi:MAG: hypothetical protein QOK19_2378 [Solirubrobacteraceae bacterium]|nr:hypothetical protein [Solirubrobacteraceae bacterium]
MLTSSLRGPARQLAMFLGLLMLSLAFSPSAGAAVHRNAHRTVAVPAALKAAAARSARADHRLVAQARGLHACLRKSGGRAGACTGSRSAVQSAGHAFTLAQRALAARAAATGRRGAYSSFYSRTPALKASGYKLNWTSVPRVRGYVLVAEVPGQGNRYSVVHGTSATPPPVPGVTVTYVIRTAVHSSHWSNPVKVTYPPAPPAPTPTPTPPAGGTEGLNLRAAPELRASGQALTWNLVAGVSSYVLMTQVPGQGEAFTSVSGTSYTPPAVPGKTVSYSIRTAIAGSAWAPNVTITYPAAPTEPPPSGPSVGVGASTGFQPGINSGTNAQDYVGATFLGAKIVRIEMPIGAPASALESTVANYAARGIRVAPLAGFYGKVPTPAEAQNLAGWAKMFGPGGTFWAKRTDGRLAIQTIEFGNETSAGYQYHDNAGDPSYQERAKNYALRLKEAATAISGTGVNVGLLAVSEDWTGDWMNGMFSAVPNLGSYITGWISHPYGSGWRSKVEGLIKQAAAHGAPSNLPIDITEWGISTDGASCVNDNYGLNPCMSYAEAGEVLRKNVSEIKGLIGSRLGLFLIYQVRDQLPAGVSKDREAYFGLLQHEGQPKGAFTTAVQELLAL